MNRRAATTQQELVEAIAQERVKYQNIFNEQAGALREDPVRSKAARTEFEKSSLVAKRGQNWIPSTEQVDAYLAQCDRLCLTVPVTFEDRVKIMHAAHAGLMCVIMCRMGQQSERIQLAVLRRYAELRGRPKAPASELPLSKPSGEPRRLTATEIQLLQDPDKLHGKQFIFSPDTGSAGMFEVIGYRRSRDKTVQYDVLFEDCGNSIMVDAEETRKMLGDSLFLPAR